MIESGSHTPGIDVGQFALPASTAMRWERPDGALEGLIGDYFAFDSEGPGAMGAVEWMLPNWPSIRFVLAENPITIEGEGLLWSPLCEAGFYGPTSQVMRHTSYGGVTIGVSLTPAGIARLFDIDVSRYRDKMVPLGELLPADDCASLVQELRASDQGPAVKPILDRFFRARMAESHPAESDIVAVNRLLLDERIQTARELAKEIGMQPPKLRRLALKRFGFPPKTLLIRTRFLRSLVALKEASGTPGYQAIDAFYTDTSHFLRDCERFLGMTARQFLKLETPFLDSILRARKLILGTATPALGPEAYRSEPLHDLDAVAERVADVPA
jgi:AraC-like DNA-binding protein